MVSPVSRSMPGPMGGRRSNLGEILIEVGVISHDQLNQALAAADGSDKDIAKWLIDLGYTTEEKIMKGIGIKADIDHIVSIWKQCLSTYGGPYLFGAAPCAADAMYAPVVTRFMTYDVKLDKTSADYCKRIMALPAMVEWIAAAALEPEEIDELDAEF